MENQSQQKKVLIDEVKSLIRERDDLEKSIVQNKNFNKKKSEAYEKSIIKLRGQRDDRDKAIIKLRGQRDDRDKAIIKLRERTKLSQGRRKKSRR